MPPRKKRAASAPPKGDASPLKKAAIEAITCPITRQLVVDPVVAEDENTYESAAIRQWLQSNYRSPMTNESNEDTVVDVVTEKQLEALEDKVQEVEQRWNVRRWANYY